MKNRKLKKGAASKLGVSIVVIIVVGYVITALTYGIFTQIHLVDAIFDPSGIGGFLATTERINLLIPIALSIMFAIWVFKIIDIWERKYEDAEDYGLHGTSKWADIHSLQDGKTLSTPSKSKFSSKDIKKNFNMENGYILGKVPNKNKLLIMPDDTDIDNQNIMVIGSSGAAKSQAYVLPNLVNVRNKSTIVTDPKGELYDLTAQLKADQGFKVYQIDFIHFMQSRYNFFDFVENDLQAQTIANTIISNFSGESSGDAFFKNSATNMLSALIIYVKATYPKEEANMDTLIDVYTNYIQDEETFHEWIDTVPDEHPAKAMLNSILDLTGNTRSSVTSSLNNGLSIFKLQKVRHMTKVSDFKIEDFVKEKSVLYVKLSMEDDTFAPLTSVFFSQMLDIFYDVAKRSPGQTLPKPVTFLLDEFANIGKINKYSRVLATCRSLGISMHTIIQNIAQLEDKSMYGSDATKAILSNHDTTIILRAKQEDTTTTTWISKALGDTTKKQKKDSVTHSRSGASSKSTNYDYVKRPLMSPDEVGKLEKNECIVLISGKDPIFCHKSFQFEVYKGLLTDKNRQPNYVNVRNKLGYTSPLIKEPEYDIEEELSFTEFQKQYTFNSEQGITKIGKYTDSKEEQTDENEDELSEEEIKMLFNDGKTEVEKSDDQEQETNNEYEEDIEEIEKELTELEMMDEHIDDDELEGALQELIDENQKQEDKTEEKEELPM